MDEKEVNDLFQYIIKWASRNEYDAIVPKSMNDDDNIDFININLKKHKIYFGDLNLDSPLTDAG